MLNFNFTWDLGVSLEQMVGFEMAAAVWSHYFTDDITINLHVASANTLGEDGQAVGGAVPLFHELNYGVFKEYYNDDISSNDDSQAYGSLEDGNNVNLMINGELIDGNTQMLVTSAQAKALGMDQALLLDNGTIWDRDVIDPNALDGYIIINQSFDWNYDFARENEAPEGTLDFFSMALHEIGHQLGFVSGIDGTLDVLQLHSGETRIEDFTLLDLFRKTINSETVSDVTLGESAYFSIDGGTTNLANFSTGDQEEDFQASHWQRLQTAMGIMDPTLAYKERLELTQLDLQAFDVLGYNLDSSKIGTSLDLVSLMEQAEVTVSEQLGINLADLSEGNGTTDLYHIGYSGWWKLFEKQIHEIGYSGWWDVLEEGYEYWQQELNGETLEIGYSSWWQLFDLKMTQLESELLAIGYSGWWQEFKNDMLAIGYSGWWEVFEIGYSGWWQALDQYYSTLGSTDNNTGSVVEQVLNQSEPSPSQTTTTGGNEDDIIAGTIGSDLISGLQGDDLIDGKAGADILIGDEGDDIVYGWDGNDTIHGGEGDDMLTGERDDDLLYGEEGADIISGDSGDDILSGGTGMDVLKGDQGRDVLIGGSDDDLLDGGEESDLLLGETGKDVLEGGKGNDIIRGDRFPTIASSNTDSSEPDFEALQALIGITAEGTSISGVNFWMRLEGESMKPMNYNQKTNAIASGGTLMTTGGTGVLSTTFTGATGVYDIVVSYGDDDSGQGKITLEVDNQEVDNWVLNQDSNGFVTRIIQGVTLTNGEEIKLLGEAHGTEYIKIDSLDIVSVNGDSTYDPSNLDPSKQLNVSTATRKIADQTFRIEAEAMTLNGYQEETGMDFASGQAMIANLSQGQAAASYVFDGNPGIYSIFASYLDGIGGSSQSMIKVNEQILSSWQLNQDTGLTDYRLIAQEISLNKGDVIEVIAQADGADLAKIDYLDFIPKSSSRLNETYNHLGITTPGLERVEAENMTLGGNYYIYENLNFASGTKVVRTWDQNGGMTATTQFTGGTGLYNIVLGYYDDNDGIGQYKATLNGIHQLDAWQGDLDLGDDIANSQTFVNRTLAQGILLNPGDELTLETIRENKDYAYLDYVDFVPYDPTAPIRVEAEYMNTSGNYAVEMYDFASSGRVMSSTDEDPNNALKVNTTFTGRSGQYTIVVRYFDDNEGIAQFSASLGGELIDSWSSDLNFADSNPSVNNSMIRTVAPIISLNPGDILEIQSIADKGKGQKADNGAIDYVEFIPYIPTTEYSNPNEIQLEIEDMQLTGGQVVTTNFAHGSGYVATQNNNNSQFTASTLFTAEEGYYDIEIGYYDTNQGQAGVTVKLNEDQLSSWVNQQDFGTTEAEVQSFTTRTVAQAVYLEKEDVIQIIGQENRGDLVNADYIRLIPVEPPVLSPELTRIDRTINLSENGDILRGGIGNDQLFGDEGDDLIYGEDEYDTPNSSTVSHDTIEGGMGNDIVYGNSGNDILYGYQANPATTSSTETMTIDGQTVTMIVTDGQDILTGNSGNDSLFGNDGNDILNGTDAVSVGTGEQDVLTGGAGADKFILGNVEKVYYLGQGDLDFVTVTDFNPNQDSLQIYGTINDYQRLQQGSDLWLSYQGDLVAIFQNTTTDSFNEYLDRIYDFEFSDSSGLAVM